MSNNRHENTTSYIASLKNEVDEQRDKMNEAYTKWKETDCLNCLKKRATWQEYKREEKLYYTTLDFIQVLLQKLKDSAPSPRLSVDHRIAASPTFKLLRRNLNDRFPTIDNPWACPEGKGSIRSDSSSVIRSETSGSKKEDEKKENGTKEDKRSLKTIVGNHYRSLQKVKNKQQVQLQCCVTGEWGEGREVIVAHLLPKRTDQVWLDRLEIADVDNFRNLILLAYQIESAFDRQQLCFVPKEVEGRIEMVLHILDDKVRETKIHAKSERTIGEYDGEPMKFKFGRNPKMQQPFSRVLSLHALKSYEIAKKKGWVPAGNDTPPEFKYNSISPLEGDIMTLIKEDHDLNSSNISEVSLDDLAEINKSSTSPTMEAVPSSSLKSSFEVEDGFSSHTSNEVV